MITSCDVPRFRADPEMTRRRPIEQHQPARARCQRTTDGRDVLARQRALQRVACARVTSLHAPTISIGLPAPSRAQATRAVPGTLSGIRTGSWGAGSVGVGVGLGTTTGLGIVSGISMGSEPG